MGSRCPGRALPGPGPMTSLCSRPGLPSPSPKRLRAARPSAISALRSAVLGCGARAYALPSAPESRWIYLRLFLFPTCNLKGETRCEGLHTSWRLPPLLGSAPSRHQDRLWLAEREWERAVFPPSKMPGGLATARARRSMDSTRPLPTTATPSATNIPFSSATMYERSPSTSPTRAFGTGRSPDLESSTTAANIPARTGSTNTGEPIGKVSPCGGDAARDEKACHPCLRVPFRTVRALFRSRQALADQLLDRIVGFKQGRR